MKVFIIVLVLVFSLQSLTKADDIRDFQIEGMSAGESLLDYFSEEEIKKNILKNLYKYKKDKTFVTVGLDILDGYNFNTYEVLQIKFKRNDKNYIIHGISGKIFSNYNEDIRACFDHLDKVFYELQELFKNQEKYSAQTIKHQADKSGKSKVRQAGYIFKQSRDVVLVECYDWDKNMGYDSNFKVSVSTKELNDWFLADN